MHIYNTCLVYDTFVTVFIIFSKQKFLKPLKLFFNLQRRTVKEYERSLKNILYLVEKSDKCAINNMKKLHSDASKIIYFNKLALVKGKYLFRLFMVQ